MRKVPFKCTIKAENPKPNPYKTQTSKLSGIRTHDHVLVFVPSNQRENVLPLSLLGEYAHLMFSDFDKLEDLVAAMRNESSTFLSSRDPEETIPILIAPASERTARLGARSSTVKEMDMYLDRIAGLQKDLIATAEQIASYKAAMLQASSPIFVLPSEILLMIFSFLCPSGDDSALATSRSRLSILATCSRWRSLMISTPSFWTEIPITASSTQEMVTEFSRRARNAPLRLYLLRLDNDDDEDIYPNWPTIELTPSLADRVVHVTFDTEIALRWLEFPPEFVLESVTFQSSKDRYHFDLYDGPWLSAHSMLCRGVAMFPNDEDEEFLRLENLRLSGLDLDAVWATLQPLRAPMLSVLWLSDIEEGPTRRTRLLLPITATLRHLHISGTDVSARCAGLVLGHCEWPAALDSLSLCVTEAIHIDDAESMGLIFQYAQNARTVTITCVASLVLYMLDEMAEVEMLKLETLTIGRIVPTLENMTHDVSTWEIDARLGALFDARARRGQKPLGELRISRSFMMQGNEWPALAARVGRLEVLDD